MPYSVLSYIGMFSLGLLFMYVSDHIYRFLRFPGLSCKIDWAMLKRESAWVMITGPTAGIGRGIAQCFAERGLNVVLVSRNLKKLEAVKKDLEERNPKVQIEIIVIDLSDPTSEEDKRMCDRLRAKEKPIRILINNAGLTNTYPRPYHDMETDVLDNIVKVNVFSLQRYTHVLLCAHKSAVQAVINIGSIAGVAPSPLLSVYAGTKAFVKHWTLSLHDEYKGKVHIELVTPFYVVSNMTGGEHRKGTWFTPKWDAYATDLVGTIGYRRWTFPHWFHIFMHMALRLSPYRLGAMAIHSVNYRAWKRGLKREERHKKRDAAKTAQTQAAALQTPGQTEVRPHGN